MSFSPLIRQLIDSLRILPGVGQKTAQRMALQLLERDRSGGMRLAHALSTAMEGVGHCQRCRTLCEDPLCPQCDDPRRDDSVLCVVEGPLDVFGVDKMDLNGVVLTAQFRTVSGGQYAVSRAFNQRLKKLVDNSPWVHFAQTYPQQVLLPKRRQEGEVMASELPQESRT